MPRWGPRRRADRCRPPWRHGAFHLDRKRPALLGREAEAAGGADLGPAPASPFIR